MFYHTIDYENNYIGSGVSPSHHNNQHHHQYAEAPEPIIEIIIQDNEHQPEPQPIVQSNGKKKKEQVQVFYVKYHKDEKHGLVIHDPVAALSPAGHEQHDEDNHEELTIVTPQPKIPRKTTTLRTIIRPESEQYESISGVHVSFNKPHNHHSKSDNHIHDEEKVESAIQPVIQLPQNRVGPLPIHPIKEKRQQPISQFSQAPFNQGRIVNSHSQPTGNFHLPPQHLVQPNQRPHVEFNPQNNFISHPHQGFLSTQLTLPNQDASKPFHPNAPPNHIHQQPQFLRNQQPLSIPINHQQSQQAVLGHQQPLLKPPQRLPPPQVNFNQNQRPFNFHAHPTQSQASQQAQNIQRPQQIQPPRQGPPPQNFHNFNHQLPPLNRPPVQFNSQFQQQQQHQFLPHQGPPLNFKPEHKPQQPIIQQHQFVQQQPPVQHSNGVFQGGLVEQAAPNLASSRPHFIPPQQQQLPKQAPPPQFHSSQPDVHFNQHKFIQSSFGTDVQVSSSVPKYEHHITETVNPPVFFNPTALDMDKIAQDKERNKNIGHLTQQQQQQQPILQSNVQHRFAPPQSSHGGVSNHFSEVFPQIEHNNNNNNNHFSASNNFVDVNGRNKFTAVTSSQVVTTTTTTKQPATTSTTVKVKIQSSTTAKPPAYFDLPDEIPDDLRKQLEESGVLENAQISILDYDKLGETNLHDLPPEHLANFFSAGGGSQIGASNKVISVLKPNGESVGNKLQALQGNKDFSKIIEAGRLPSKKEDVNLRVVKFDTQSQKNIPEKFIQPDSKVLTTVNVNQNYSRYLPIKINGAHFPIPDAEELRGKKISSVVVLAPVSQDEESIDDGRYERDTFEAKQIKFLSGEILKNLIKKPSADNFRRWLDREQKTASDLQSVVLLVTK